MLAPYWDAAVLEMITGRRPSCFMAARVAMLMAGKEPLRPNATSCPR